MTDFNQALLSHQVGQKQYELSNHLGNVQATVTDLPVPQGEYVYEYNSPALAAAYDYYPFGMLMPGRYVSDTTQQCATVTQTKWVTTYIDSCYDVVIWGNLRQAVLIGNGHVSTHTGTIQIEAATVNDGFGFHMDALPLSEQELSIDIDDMSGTGIMQAAELVNGNWVSLGSASLTKGRITLRVLPTTSDISVRVLGPVIMQVRRVCIKVPGLSQESMLVDICDGDGDRYRFGFNGQEKVNEWSGVGNFMEYTERGFDSRMARSLTLDPRSNEYPWQTSYAYHRNSPIVLADYLGGGDPPNFEAVSNVKNVLKNTSWVDYDSPHFEPGRLLKGKSPVFKNCWHAARDQIVLKNPNYKPALDNQRVNMYQHKDQSKTGTQTAVNLQKGVDVITRNLNQGLPVMVGVMYQESKDTENSNRATNHYINVVGMGTDEKGVYFSYYDNYGGKDKGTDLQENKFYYDVGQDAFIDNSSPPIGDDKTYTMTEVRDNEKQPEFDKQKIEDMRLNEGMKTPGNW